MPLPLTQAKKEQIFRLSCEGLSQNEIASRAGVCQSIVSRTLLANKAMWQRKMAESFEFHLADNIARLREVERRFWKKRDLENVARCIAIELKAIGALRNTKVEVVPSDLWAQVAQTLAARAPDPVAEKLAAVEGNGHAEG
jgi:hypothetical protein